MKQLTAQGGMVVVVLSIGMLIVPLPTGLLDFLFVFNLALSLIVTAVALQTQEPLELSSFPTLLLITTLLRVALDISAARLILLNANAGTVVAAFGNFVVGGNLVVGFLMFILLFVVQFLVITRGAERVAEVSARFTLDAMAGKQMAVDADLHAGAISDEEAKARRQRIAREADFYGAMDGATKFVRGDAIATLVVLIINTLAGLLVGVLIEHLGFGAAVHTYTALAIGDALLSQLPAFLLSTAAGILVTRSNAQQDALTTLLGRQLTARPEPFYIVAGFLAFLALLLHVFVVALGLAGLAFYAGWHISHRPPPTRPPAPAPAPPPAGSELPDPLGLTLGYGLLALADPAAGGDLIKRLAGVADRLSRDLGFGLPRVHIRDDLSLDPNRYRLRIRSLTVAEGMVHPGHELVIERPAELPLGTLEGTEPIYGLPALWVRNQEVTQLAARGISSTPASAVIAAHVKTAVGKEAHRLFDRQALDGYLDKVRRADKAVVEDLIPALLPLGVVHRVLQNLLREGVPVADGVTILEALAEYAPTAKQDAIVLTERVRAALAATIRGLVFAGGEPALITFDDSVEATLEQAVQASGPDPGLSLGADLQQRLTATLREARARWAEGAAVLVSPRLRPFLARWLEAWVPDLPVLSFAEIDPTQHYAIEQVSLS